MGHLLTSCLGACVVLAAFPAVHARGQSRPDAHQVIDLALAHWLTSSPNLTRSKPKLEADEAIVLIRKHLPQSYEPRIAGRRVILADAPLRTDPKVPLRPEAEKGQEGEAPLKISYHVLYLDGVTVRGDTATVQVSDNRHHNQGASGTTYTLERRATGWARRPGWVLLAPGDLWMR